MTVTLRLLYPCSRLGAHNNNTSGQAVSPFSLCAHTQLKTLTFSGETLQHVSTSRARSAYKPHVEYFLYIFLQLSVNGEARQIIENQTKLF